MKRTIIILVLLLILLLPIGVNAVESDTVTLSSCVDSESARFIKGVLEIKVKFVGLQTEDKITDTQDDEINGSLTSDYVCSILTNAKQIRIEYEPSVKEDKYGRVQAWVFVDNSLLQEDLIKNGYARAMYLEEDYLYANNIKEAQSYAKENKLGIWMEKEVVPLNNKEETKEEESKGIIEIIVDFFISIFRKIKEFVDSIINNIL